MLKPPITLRPKPPPRNGPGTAAPIAWWKLDETLGTTGANAVGKQFACSILGDVRWAPHQGHQQGALEFTGCQNSIECTDSADLDLRDNFSISAWFKPRPASAFGTIISKGEAWELKGVTATGAIEFTLTGPQPSGTPRSNPLRLISNRPLTELEWHHVAAVYDGARITLFVDGIEADSIKASGPVVLNNLPVVLGGNATRRGAFCDGWLDDVRLFEGSLSAEQVKNLHSGSL